jgi:hypothetical protein
MLMKYKDLGKMLSKDEMKKVKGGGPGGSGCPVGTCGTGNWCALTWGQFGKKCYCFLGSTGQSSNLLCAPEGS